MIHKHWRNDEAVDGAGLPLTEHAADIAAALSLDERQRGILIAELRNALVPAIHFVEASGNIDAAKGIERVLALASALR